MIQRIFEDHNRVHEKFTPIYKSPEIKDPLKQSMRISDSFEKYLTTIDRISRSGRVVTNESIANELSLSDFTVVLKFFNRNSAVMEEFVNIDKTNRPTTYTLTDKGVDAVSLIRYFKDYYNSI